MRRLIEKYTHKTDGIHDAAYLKKVNGDKLQIERLVLDIKTGQRATQFSSDQVGTLEDRLEATRADTAAQVTALVEAKAKEVAELRADLTERKKMISYYDRFMEVERHQIIEQIEELKGLIQEEHHAKES
jgi:hypothetical protein